MRNEAANPPRPSAVRGRVDAVSALTAYLVVLLGVPATLKITALRGVGSPSLLVGLALAAWWVYWQLQRSEPTRAGAQPVRTAFLVFLTCCAISFVVAMTRPIDQSETNAALTGVIGLVSWGGSLLLANDGIPSRDRLLVLLRRVVLVGALLALLGLVQFVSGQRLIDQISFPGMTNTQGDSLIGTRSGFNRPSGTALHPIEFGYVITMILPLAVNLAVVERARSWWVRVTPTVLMLLSVVTSLSRSAIVCSVVGLLVAAVVWPSSLRRAALLLTPVLVVGVFVTIPGLLGTVLGLFTGISEDSSALSRTSSYAIAGEFFARAPFFGRGFATFTPSYRILDNAYLLLLIEVGLVGLVSVLALQVVGIWCARRARRLGRPEEQVVAQGLVAALVSGLIGLAFFDGFNFPMASGMLFFMLGVVGATWRLARQRDTRSRPEPSARDATARRAP